MLLEIKDLYASTEDREILQGLQLQLRPGEIHAIMGPNGAGKSTLAKVLAGDPAYDVRGQIFFNQESLEGLAPEERARKGLFLGFQYPVEIPGVSNFKFLHAAHQARQKERGESLLSEEAMKEYLQQVMRTFKIPSDFMSRGVNEGFSGGEKKRNEILQMAVLDPKLAILDETDSGLDIDALKAVAEGLRQLARPDNSFILITHYQRLLDYIEPHVVHVMVNGRIVLSGGPDLAKRLEIQGYDWLTPGTRT